MAVHPPAMGGKTAWGVSEVVSRPTDNPEDILKMRKLQADFSQRESERLDRLHEMERQGSSALLESRRNRRLEFQPQSTQGDTFRKRQDEILKKMYDARERKRLEKREKRKQEQGEGGEEKEKKKSKKQKKKEESSSSSSSASGASSSSSSSSEEEEKPSKAPEPAAPSLEQIAQRRAAEEARAKEKELKRRAKEQASAWAAEARRREAEAEAQRQVEAKRRLEEAEAARQAEAKRKAEQAEAKRRAEEEEAKAKAKASEAKKSLFKIEKRKSGIDSEASRRETVAGGFYKGQRVVAAQDITVRGALVVKAGAAGTVVGASESDPTGRLAVRFLQREDTGLGNLNVVPREIKKG